jgi:hypothetical protein
VVSKSSIRFKVKADTEGFKRRNIFNISSIESLGSTKELGLRGGLEITSNDIFYVLSIHNVLIPDPIVLTY